jgi:hypothetical protein
MKDSLQQGYLAHQLHFYTYIVVYKVHKQPIWIRWNWEIEFCDSDTFKRLFFLTNNYKLAALEIAIFYKIQFVHRYLLHMDKTVFENNILLGLEFTCENSNLECNLYLWDCPCLEEETQFNSFSLRNPIDIERKHIWQRASKWTV